MYSHPLFHFEETILGIMNFAFVFIYGEIAFNEEKLYTPNDSLGIEVAIEPFVEASLEIEEEQHHFTGL